MISESELAQQKHEIERRSSDSYGKRRWSKLLSFRTIGVGSDEILVRNLCANRAGAQNHVRGHLRVHRYQGIVNKFRKNMTQLLCARTFYDSGNLDSFKSNHSDSSKPSFRSTARSTLLPGKLTQTQQCSDHLRKLTGLLLFRWRCWLDRDFSFWGEPGVQGLLLPSRDASLSLSDELSSAVSLGGLPPPRSFKVGRASVVAAGPSERVFIETDVISKKTCNAERLAETTRGAQLSQKMKQKPHASSRTHLRPCLDWEFVRAGKLTDCATCAQPRETARKLELALQPPSPGQITDLTQSRHRCVRMSCVCDHCDGCAGARQCKSVCEWRACQQCQQT